MTLEETFFTSVKGAFGRSANPMWPAWAALLLALVALAILFASWRTRRRAHRVELASARQVAERTALSADAFEYLGSLSRAAEVSLHTALTRIGVFERVTALALSELPATHMPEVGSPFEVIRQVRLALGFNVVPPHHWLFTTRELPQGEKLTIAGRPALVIDVNEACFSVLIAGAASASVPDQQPVMIELVRPDDGRYLLRCYLLHTATFEGQPHLFFAHDENPQRQQLREWVRVRVDRPVRCQIVHAARGSASTFEGQVVDLSAGGMSVDAVALPARVVDGTLLYCHFELGNQARFDELLAVVVEARPTERGKHLRLAFAVLADSERDRLVAAVAWHERQQVREASG